MTAGVGARIGLGDGWIVEAMWNGAFYGLRRTDQRLVNWANNGLAERLSRRRAGTVSPPSEAT